MTEKMGRFFGHAPRCQHARVTDWQHDVIRRAGNAGFFDRDDAIVGSGQVRRDDPSYSDAAGAGNHAELSRAGPGGRPFRQPLAQAATEQGMAEGVGFQFPRRLAAGEGTADENDAAGSDRKSVV